MAASYQARKRSPIENLVKRKTMSIIQKLENSYLEILRVVVIIAASFLLLGAVVLGAMSLKGMLPASAVKAEIVPVDPKDVLAKVAPDEKKAAPADAPNVEKSDERKGSSRAPEYEKIFTTVNLFVTKYSKDTLHVSKDSLFQFLDTKSNAYGSGDVKSKYVMGLAAAIDASLQDKRVISRVEKPAAAAKQVAPAPAPQQDGTQNDEAIEPVQVAPVIVEKAYKESPLAVVEEVVETYTQMFDQTLEQAKEAQNAQQMEQMAAKANSTMRMYVAAGVFGIFLLVIFLSIVIRIERNLRTIASKP
jgi:hypothetical protein